MTPSHFDKNDTQVFVEIFAVPVNGTIFKFSVQRRFVVAENGSVTWSQCPCVRIGTTTAHRLCPLTLL